MYQYPKQILTIEQQVQSYVDAGMKITSQEDVEKALKSIGFYRLRLSAECYDKHFAIFILIKNSHLFTYNRTASLCEKRDISKYRLYFSTKVFTLFYSLCFFLSVVL